MTPDERAIRRAAIADYNRFMRVNATGHQIHVFIRRHRLTPGVDWQGSSKGDMAEYFATRGDLGDAGTMITPEIVTKLEEQFGKRDG